MTRLPFWKQKRKVEKGKLNRQHWKRTEKDRHVWKNQQKNPTEKVDLQGKCHQEKEEWWKRKSWLDQEEVNIILKMERNIIWQVSKITNLIIFWTFLCSKFLYKWNFLRVFRFMVCQIFLNILKTKVFVQMRLFKVV